MFNVTPLATTVVPEPDIVPLVQLDVPPSVIIPEPARVPPDMFKMLIAAAVLKFTVPPVMLVVPLAV